MTESCRVFILALFSLQIMDHGSPVSWDDIAGLTHAKKTIQEIVVWPMMRPYVFPFDTPEMLKYTACDECAVYEQSFVSLLLEGQ